ncbi:hypothetical protein B0H10DRAFT_2436258 [Mycena sp. CBHHK59/15]|nr:hypothetical protein B0H10DRAFT_2436258 [Mycena sp. CBHHK59/15]
MSCHATFNEYEANFPSGEHQSWSAEYLDMTAPALPLSPAIVSAPSPSPVVMIPDLLPVAGFYNCRFPVPFPPQIPHMRHGLTLPNNANNHSDTTLAPLSHYSGGAASTPNAQTYNVAWTDSSSLAPSGDPTWDAAPYNATLQNAPYQPDSAEDTCHGDDSVVHLPLVDEEFLSQPNHRPRFQSRAYPHPYLMEPPRYMPTEYSSPYADLDSFSGTRSFSIADASHTTNSADSFAAPGVMWFLIGAAAPSPQPTSPYTLTPVQLAPYLPCGQDFPFTPDTEVDCRSQYAPNEYFLASDLLVATAGSSNQSFPVSTSTTVHNQFQQHRGYLQLARPSGSHVLFIPQPEQAVQSMEPTMRQPTISPYQPYNRRSQACFSSPQLDANMFTPPNPFALECPPAKSLANNPAGVMGPPPVPQRVGRSKHRDVAHPYRVPRTHHAPAMVSSGISLPDQQASAPVVLSEDGTVMRSLIDRKAWALVLDDQTSGTRYSPRRSSRAS